MTAEEAVRQMREYAGPTKMPKGMPHYPTVDARQFVAELEAIVRGWADAIEAELKAKDEEIARLKAKFSIHVDPAGNLKKDAFVVINAFHCRCAGTFVPSTAGVCVKCGGQP